MQRAPCRVSSSARVGQLARACQSRTRSATGRDGGLTRANSMKPVGLAHVTAPTTVSADRRARAFGAAAARPEHALVVARHHLDERAPIVAGQSLEQARAERAAGVARRAARCSSCTSVDLVVVARAARGRPCRGCSGAGTCRRRRARRRCRRSCRRRSCARSRPSTTTRPPVMYSQPWSPTPSTTAWAPLLRTANRSPATPRK